MSDKKYVFQELQEFAAEYDANYTVSAALKNKKLGDEVIIGGRVKRHSKDLFHPANYYFELDDDVDTISVYLVGPVYNEFKEWLKPDNLLIAKGYLAERPGIKARYVICTSMTLVNKESPANDMTVEP
jgi:hypothetical protein